MRGRKGKYAVLATMALTKFYWRDRAMLRCSDDALMLDTNAASMRDYLVYLDVLHSWTDAVAVNTVLLHSADAVPRGRRPHAPLLDVMFGVPIVKAGGNPQRGVYPLTGRCISVGEMCDLAECFTIRETKSEATCARCFCKAGHKNWLAPTDEGQWVCGSCMIDVMRKRILPQCVPRTGRMTTLEDIGRVDVRLMADPQGRVYLAATGRIVPGLEYDYVLGELQVVDVALGGGQEWVRSSMTAMSDICITAPMKKGTSPAKLDSSSIRKERHGILLESKRRVRSLARQIKPRRTR